MSNPMEKLFSSLKEFTEGMIVTGKILEVRPNEVLVDIGYKSEGVIPRYEFDEPDSLKPGDEVEVLLEKIEDEDGMVVLSHDKAEQKKNWDRIVSICSEGGTIEGKVRAKVKGGLTVNIGVEAFLPASQIDVIPPRNLDEYVGKTFKFKVVKINQERKNIVLSRRELIEQEREDKRRKLLAEMQVGQVRTGVVKNLTDFGAFIDLDGLDGLLHITDMSWGRINHPSELVKVGETIEVMILEVDREKERVSLGLKQKNRNPWDDIALKYPVGSKVHGKVVSVVPYGAFVQLEDGVEGMVHVSRIVLDQARRPRLGCAQGGRRSRCRCAGDQARRAEDFPRHPPTRSQSVVVRSQEVSARHQDYRQGPQPDQLRRVCRGRGRHRRHDPRVRHVLDAQSDQSGRDPQERPESRCRGAGSGRSQPADVARHETTGGRSRGRPSTSATRWATWSKARSSSWPSFGAFVELEDKLEGLVHISQISEQRIEKIKDALKVGDEVAARVIKIDSQDRRHRPEHQSRELHRRPARSGKADVRRRAQARGSNCRSGACVRAGRGRQKPVGISVQILYNGPAP